MECVTLSKNQVQNKSQLSPFHLLLPVLEAVACIIFTGPLWHFPLHWLTAGYGFGVRGLFDWVLLNQNQSYHYIAKQKKGKYPNEPKRTWSAGKTRVAKSCLVLVLNLISWDYSSASLMD